MMHQTVVFGPATVGAPRICSCLALLRVLRACPTVASLTSSQGNISTERRSAYGRIAGASALIGTSVAAGSSGRVGPVAASSPGAGLVAASGPLTAAAPGVPPLRAAVMTNSANGNLTNSCTHDSPCGSGSNRHNCWALDPFDYSNNAPVYNVKAGSVQATNGCGTAARIGGALSGSGRLYCHGKNLEVAPNQTVATGTVVMKISNSGASAVHLHYEKRTMSEYVDDVTVAT